MYLLAIKQNDDALVLDGARLLMKRYVNDLPTAGDPVDDAIRKIIVKANAEDAYTSLAELIVGGTK